MNKEILQGKWNQLQGEVKKTWGKLTDDELKEIEGDYDKMIGKLREVYGYKREEAEKEAEAFLSKH